MYDTRPARVAPTWTETVAARASAPIGGPLGRHAMVGRSRFWSPLRVALLAAVLVLAAGWLLKAPCLQQNVDSDGQLALDWSGSRQYVAMCYSDVVTLYTDHRLAGGGLPYLTHWESGDEGEPARTHYMDYPVVSGFFVWVTARLTARYHALADDLPFLPNALPEVLFFDITALFLAAAWLVVVWAVRRQRALRPWDTMLVALSPVALLHVFTGTDAVAVAGAAAGLYAFARGRSVLAGVLLGVGAAAKLYVALLLIPLVLLSWRRYRRDQEDRIGPDPPPDPYAVPIAVITAVLTWVVVNAPVAVFLTDGWLEFVRVGISAQAAPDSIYYALSYLTGWPGFDGLLAPWETPTRLNLVVLAFFLAALVGLAVLVVRAPRAPRLASLCFLLVAAALLVNKSWSPQFSLWLVPLAVLALPRWRLLLAWMTVDALVWVPRMFYYLGEERKGLPPEVFLGYVLVRDAVLVGLMVVVVRSVLKPRTDPVRLFDTDDPDWPGAERDRSAVPASVPAETRRDGSV